MIDLHSKLKRYFSEEEVPGEKFQSKMAPSSRNPMKVEHATAPTLSAVLVLLYPKDDTWHIALTKRHTYDGNHSGQVSLPGGKVEPSDTGLLHTALRETEEEIGVRCIPHDAVGALTTLHIPISNFLVHPFVALLNEAPSFDIDDHEVAHLIEMPLTCITDPQYVKHKEMTNRHHRITAPYYNVNENVVWGATAMILAEFGEVVRRVYTMEREIRQ